MKQFWLRKIYLKMSAKKWRPFCPSLSVLTHSSWKWCQRYSAEWEDSDIFALLILCYIHWNPKVTRVPTSLQWRHNGHDGVSNHQPHHCLLNHLFGRRSKKTLKLCVTGLCAGIHRGPVNSLHKWPVTRKMSPFDDIMIKWTHSPVVLQWSLMLLQAFYPMAAQLS